MRTVLLENGAIMIPQAVRKKLNLRCGTSFDVFVDGEEAIVLRRVARPANAGLIDHLLACPFPFVIPDERLSDRE